MPYHSIKARIMVVAARPFALTWSGQNDDEFRAGLYEGGGGLTQRMVGQIRPG